ncbi:MAG: hypothetical protein COB84_04935 [Rhodobacteraceae bacterium]|nr:MAG: hypothetical protein COB84_04935 [Paracoccaceae bacterium]
MLCSVALILAFSDKSHTFAQTAVLDELFVALKNPENAQWQATEKKIWRHWSHSGSAAMDHLLKRGSKAKVAGQYREAVEHYSAAIDHAPDFAEGWHKRGVVFYALKEYGLALADLQQVLILIPRHFGALTGLGTLLERLDRPKDALIVYRRALEIHPRKEGLEETVKRLQADVEGQKL